MLIKLPTNRFERIKILRIHICIHQHMMQRDMLLKGPYHFDTIHELEVVEELSSSLHDELEKLEIEHNEEKMQQLDGWDTIMMTKIYDD